MSVSPGGALLWSAALHVLGFGLAGWATHGGSRESMALAPRTTRAYTIHYLLPAKPRPRPELSTAATAVRQRRSALARRGQPAALLGALKVEPRTVAPPALTRMVVRPRHVLSAPGLPPQPPPVTARVERAAALIGHAGSACPELRDFSVAVAFVVDTGGRVEREAIRLVEAPGYPAVDRGFYPRIYVVGARSRGAARVERAGYDSAIVRAVVGHVAGLKFQPAMKNGRRVRSTVLVACQGSSLLSP